MHIIGASGHAKVIVDIIQESGLSIEGIWDENPDIKNFVGYAIAGNFADFKSINTNEVIIAIGNNSIRKRIAAELLENVAVAIHPRAFVSRYSTIGAGTVIMANATVNANASVGSYAIVNTNASIDHDCVIENFVHISPQAGIAGNVLVGEGSHVGIGASVIQGINIGKWTTIGAGTVVINDVPDFAVVVGNPGRIIKYNKSI